MVMGLLPLVLLTLSATAGAAGGPCARRPAALVVVTPGMGRSAFDPLVEALRSAGFDAWTAEFPPGAPLPEEGADHEAGAWIRAALGAIRRDDRRGILVGHGPGATLALLAAPGAAEAVVALGPLLGPPDTEVARYLATLPVGAGSVDLAAPLAWHGHDVASLLLGEPMPPLGPLSAPLARTWQRWILEGPPLDPAAVTCPVWIAAGARDRLAPVETVRGPAGRLPDATFVRFGRLRFDRRDPGSGALLRERAVLRVMTRWLRRTLGLGAL